MTRSLVLAALLLVPFAAAHGFDAREGEATVACAARASPPLVPHVRVLCGGDRTYATSDSAGEYVLTVTRTSDDLASAEFCLLTLKEEFVETGARTCGTTSDSLTLRLPAGAEDAWVRVAWRGASDGLVTSSPAPSTWGYTLTHVH